MLEDVIEGNGAIRVSEKIDADPEALLANASSLVSIHKRPVFLWIQRVWFALAVRVEPLCLAYGC